MDEPSYISDEIGSVLAIPFLELTNPTHLSMVYYTSQTSPEEKEWGKTNMRRGMKSQHGLKRFETNPYYLFSLVVE